MTFTVLHVRSGEAGKRPNPSDLQEGQLAVNYNGSQPGLFFKIDSGSIAKVGPAFIGPEEPGRTSNWDSLSIGEQWVDTADENTLKIWNGVRWLEIAGGGDGSEKGEKGQKGDLGLGTKGSKGDPGTSVGSLWEVNSNTVRPKSQNFPVVPHGDGNTSLGTATLRWSHMFTQDLHLSNEGKNNEVDGSWGSWTIQEGEDDLFIINRRSGKKFKFNLEEVTS